MERLDDILDECQLALGLGEPAVIGGGVLALEHPFRFEAELDLEFALCPELFRCAGRHGRPQGNARASEPTGGGGGTVVGGGG